MLKICHNVLLGVGVICIAVVAVASIAYGHNHVEVAFATIAGIVTAVPPVVKKLGAGDQ